MKDNKIINLGRITMSVASSLIAKHIRERESFNCSFIIKGTEKKCTVSFIYPEDEYKIDADGTKWKKVVE